jgi:hypothetical protein
MHKKSKKTEQFVDVDFFKNDKTLKIMVRSNKTFHFFHFKKMIYRNIHGSFNTILSFDPTYQEDIYGIGAICSHCAIFDLLSTNTKKNNNFFINWLSGKFE